MIRFLELTIEGFGSIQTPITVKFNKKGLVIVRGKNGVGKTTIFSALGWVVYGTGLKKNASVLTWEHKRYGDYAGCMVSLKLDKDGTKFQFTRCKEYTKKIEGVQGKNRLLIYKDGILQPEAKLTQANPYIQKVLGMSFELFKTSIVFGQKMKRLIEEDGPAKKKILEEICEISYIEKAKTLAEKNLTDARKELGIVNLQFTDTSASIEAKEEELDRLFILEANWEKERQAKLIELTNKLEDLNKQCSEEDISLLSKRLARSEERLVDFKNQIDDYKAKLVDLPKEQTAYDKATERKKNLKDTNTKLQTKFETLEESLKEGSNSLCSECGQQMPTNTAQNLLHEYGVDIATNKNSIAILNQAILGHKIKLASMQKVATQADTTNSKYQKELEKFRAIGTEIKDMNRILNQAEELSLEITALEKKVPQFNIETVKTEIEVLKEELEPLEDLKNKWEKKVKVYSWMISIPLSNSGLKSFIFNQMIQKVNYRLSKYASRIGFLPKMVVDLQSARKDINMVVYQGKYPVPYEDLSGGQSQLVNIAIAFSVHDVVAEDVFNMLVLDEVFESLSAENVELVSNLIAEKSHHKAIYLITHLQDFFPESHEVLEISIPGGVTELLLN